MTPKPREPYFNCYSKPTPTRSGSVKTCRVTLDQDEAILDAIVDLLGKKEAYQFEELSNLWAKMEKGYEDDVEFSLGIDLPGTPNPNYEAELAAYEKTYQNYLVEMKQHAIDLAKWAAEQ